MGCRIPLLLRLCRENGKRGGKGGRGEVGKALWGSVEEGGEALAKAVSL